MTCKVLLPIKCIVDIWITVNDTEINLVLPHMELHVRNIWSHFCIVLCSFKTNQCSVRCGDIPTHFEGHQVLCLKWFGRSPGALFKVVWETYRSIIGDYSTSTCESATGTVTEPEHSTNMAWAQTRNDGVHESTKTRPTTMVSDNNVDGLPRQRR